MTTRTVQVGPLREDQIEQAGKVLARAFRDAPIFVAMYPDPDERSRVMPWLAQWNIRHGYLFGEVRVTAGPLVGVTIAYKSDASVFTDEHFAQSLRSLPEQPSAAAWERHTKTVDVGAYPGNQLAQAVPELHWHLAMIGVDPAYQGSGIGSALLRAFHDRADADGLPTTLLTFQPKNVPLYRRHGYDVLRDGTEPVAGLHYWCFRRSAGA